MGTDFSASGHWSGDFTEPEFRTWVQDLRKQLPASSVSLGLVFIAPKLFAVARQILEVVRVFGRVPLLAGCSGQSLINAGEEIESEPGVALALYSLPAANLRAFHFTQRQLEFANAQADYWTSWTQIAPDQTNGWLAFIDPFRLDAERWLETWNGTYARMPVRGGLASGDSEGATQVYLNGDVFEEGGVAISIAGDVALAGITSQGCAPIGETWTLTKVDGNIIRTIGNRPAYEVLAETFTQLSPDEQEEARQGNLHIGLVINEYLEEFHRGDFLIRNLLGVDPQSGAIAVGAFPRAGQTIQFQRRSPAAASEDMDELLKRARTELKGRPVYGACLCSCSGRGQGLFKEPNHDARAVQSKFGPIGLAGFFCNGEIGPVGSKNFLHGYTASLALLVKKS